jgi:hypothetical protein
VVARKRRVDQTGCYDRLLHRDRYASGTGITRLLADPDCRFKEVNGGPPMIHGDEIGAVQLRARLRGVSPPVTRRLRISEQATLAQLHAVL